MPPRVQKLHPWSKAKSKSWILGIKGQKGHKISVRAVQGIRETIFRVVEKTDEEDQWVQANPIKLKVRKEFDEGNWNRRTVP